MEGVPGAKNVTHPKMSGAQNYVHPRWKSDQFWNFIITNLSSQNWPKFGWPYRLNGQHTSKFYFFILTTPMHMKNSQSLKKIPIVEPCSNGPWKMPQKIVFGLPRPRGGLNPKVFGWYLEGVWGYIKVTPSLGPLGPRGLSGPTCSFTT